VSAAQAAVVYLMNFIVWFDVCFAMCRWVTR
jgi:hypothetical protein